MRTTALAIVSLAFVVNARPTRGDIIGTFGPVTIETTHVPTPQLTGFSTWTVNATSVWPIAGFDFAESILHPSNGFFGPMNQINPGGVSTVFEDLNSVFPLFGADPAQDSQFKFLKTNITSAGNYYVESDTTLQAVFVAGHAPFGTDVDFAQVVTPDASPTPVTFRGDIVVLLNGTPTSFEVSGKLQPVPEPTTATLLLLGMLGCGWRRRRH